MCKTPKIKKKANKTEVNGLADNVLQLVNNKAEKTETASLALTKADKTVADTLVADVNSLIKQQGVENGYPRSANRRKHPNNQQGKRIGPYSTRLGYCSHKRTPGDQFIY